MKGKILIALLIIMLFPAWLNIAPRGGPELRRFDPNKECINQASFLVSIEIYDPTKLNTSSVKLYVNKTQANATISFSELDTRCYITYVVSGKHGDVFIVRVYAENIHGEALNASKKYEIDLIGPSPPHVSIIIEGDHIRLQWNAMEDTVIYQIFRSTRAAFVTNESTLLANVSTTFYDDYKVVPGTRYYYKIRGVDRAGNIGLTTSLLSVEYNPSREVLFNLLLQRNLPYIIGGTTIILIVLGVVLYIRVRYKIRLSPRERKSLVMLLVINKEGLSIFRYPFKEHLNEQLVGGFLTAIKSVGESIGAGKEITSISYEQRSIIGVGGKWVSAYLVVERKPTKKIIAKLNMFLRDFEKEYGDEIVSFSGNTDVFTDAEALIRKYFL